MTEVVIEDDGMLPVTLGGVKREIDLYCVFNTLSTMHAQVENDLAGEPDSRKQQEYHERVSEYLVTELGFPRVSHKAAEAFDAAIFAAVGEVGKGLAASQTPA